MSERKTAADLAREFGIDPKTLRAALRRIDHGWHERNSPWAAETGTWEYTSMVSALAGIVARKAAKGDYKSSRKMAAGRRRSGSDEHYVIDLCDQILGQKASRGHRFDFLRGDAAAGRVGRSLPVDAYYEGLSLVVEYRERQHSEAVAFFDRRATVSGVGRGKQRVLYDQRRRDVLPQHGIRVVELDYSEFAHDRQKRLLRTAEDRSVIEKRLASLARQPR